MTAVASLIRLRRRTLSRIAATFLLALVLSPFTAPFSTCDLAELAGEAPLHGDLLSSSKTAKDAAADITVAPCLPLFTIAPLPADSCSGDETTRSIPRLVLRL